MIVYGDRASSGDPAALIRGLADDLAAAAEMPPGIGRHGAMVGIFVELGRVTQGVADARFDKVGRDAPSPAEAALLHAAGVLGMAIAASWDSGFAALPPLPHLAPPATLPARITMRVPEGYAHYALYPEAYLEAARLLALPGATRVIGIRSIGTALAALVAAVLDAPTPLTVRPTGHPFARQVVLDQAALAAIDPAANYVVVDEGPGLSGSSFAAVATMLKARGVPRERITFLPGHAGAPGAQASAGIRRCWAEVARVVVPGETLLPDARIASWAESLVGPIEAPAADLSGGRWRTEVCRDERDWPAVDPSRERRKLLVHAGDTRWLVKFAGLGQEGDRKLDRGRMLADAGLIPDVRGMVHGFLVQKWVEAQPAASATPDDLDAIVRYLSWRAEHLPAEHTGASPRDLHGMAETNIREGIGAAAAAKFTDRTQAAAGRPMAVDGRMDRQKWLRTAGGRLLKADALDHDAGHDLIGPQDIAWDVAGAIVEWQLDGSRAERVIGGVRHVDRALLRFLLPCYAAFRLGMATMAADALVHWPEEVARNRSRANDYATWVERTLEAPIVS